MKININNVEIQITEKCINKCIYCYVGIPGKTAPTQMSSRDFFNILDKMRNEINIRTLILTGGEPTCHPGFHDFVSLAKEFFPHTRLHLQTNGRYFSNFKRSVELWALGVDSVNFSFQSYKSHVHEYIDGIPGKFPEVVSGLNNLLTVEKKYGKPTVAVNISLSKYNRDHFIRTVRWLYNFGVKVVTSNAMRPTIYNKLLWNYCLSEKELSTLFSEARHTAQSCHGIFCNFHSFNLCEHDGRIDGNEHYTCNVGKKLLSVDVRGNLVTCLNVPDKALRIVGSLLHKKTVKELWQSELIQRYRARVHLPGECQQCKLLDQCGGICSALFHWKFEKFAPTANPKKTKATIKENPGEKI